MRDRMNLLYSHGHDAHPIGAFSDSIIAECRLLHELALLPSKNRVVQRSPLNVGENSVIGSFTSVDTEYHKSALGWTGDDPWCRAPHARIEQIVDTCIIGQPV